MTIDKIIELIGEKNENLLTHTCQTIAKENLHLPSADFLDTVFSLSNRNAQTLRNMAALFNTGRLSKTGYLPILPVD